MSNFIGKDQVNKLTAGYRILSFFISVFCLLAVLSILFFGRDEEITVPFLIISAMPVVLLYVCIPIVFTGYPPKLLRWAMGKKE
ncbi:hypothetical protein Misp06_01043 [Microbulbifer sp. NBRC 101763]|uniref:hypothetical protein n=1 Tax=unclassified Microbulbifer TaxID=2619833 RepID=UPI0030A6F11C